MNTDQVFKMCFKFLVFMALVGAFLMFAADKAGATTPPARWTLQEVASYAERLAADAPGGGGMATATVEAYLATHTAKTTDPHGVNERITGSLIIGTGTPDCEVARSATGTVRIASYTVIPSELATPSEPIATGTFWNDRNTNKMKIYDGGAWHELY